MAVNDFICQKLTTVNKPVLLLVFCFSSLFSFSQDYISVEALVSDSVNFNAAYLWEDREYIRNYPALNEQLVDMVDVWETDSIIKKKRERHRVFGAAIIPLFGYYWYPITKRKEKFVGTVKGEARVPGEERFTEYDVNFNMVPHLAPYIALAYVGHVEEKRRNRKKSVEKVNKPPYTYPKTPKDIEKLHLHNECTPSVEHRKLLDSLFYPTIRPSTLATHPNFGEAGVTMGMYGPLVSDCNHECHPEIHPYEWIWWMDLNPAKDEPSQQVSEVGWYIGLLRDVSNRMKHWSSSPRTGKISIPFFFAIEKENNNFVINLEHLVHDEFYPEVLAEEIGEAAKGHNFNFTEQLIYISSLAMPTQYPVKITLKTNKKLETEGVKFWISDVRVSKGEMIMSGEFNIALSVKNLYTARVGFSYK